MYPAIEITLHLDHIYPAQRRCPAASGYAFRRLGGVTNLLPFDAASQLVRRRGPQRRTRQTTRRCPVRRIMTAGETSRSAVVAGSQRRQGFELSLFQDGAGRGGVGGDLVHGLGADDR
jgi:hypothetical protein